MDGRPGRCDWRRQSRMVFDSPDTPGTSFRHPSIRRALAEGLGVRLGNRGAACHADRISEHSRRLTALRIRGDTCFSGGGSTQPAAGFEPRNASAGQHVIPVTRARACHLTDDLVPARHLVCGAVAVVNRMQLRRRRGSGPSKILPEPASGIAVSTAANCTPGRMTRMAFMARECRGDPRLEIRATAPIPRGRARSP